MILALSLAAASPATGFLGVRHPLLWVTIAPNGAADPAFDVEADAVERLAWGRGLHVVVTPDDAPQSSGRTYFVHSVSADELATADRTAQELRQVSPAAPRHPHPLFGPWPLAMTDRPELVFLAVPGEGRTVPLWGEVPLVSAPPTPSDPLVGLLRAYLHTLELPVVLQAWGPGSPREVQEDLCAAVAGPHEEAMAGCRDNLAVLLVPPAPAPRGPVAPRPSPLLEAVTSALGSQAQGRVPAHDLGKTLGASWASPWEAHAGPVLRSARVDIRIDDACSLGCDEQSAEDLRVALERAVAQGAAELALPPDRWSIGRCSTSTCDATWHCRPVWDSGQGRVLADCRLRREGSTASYLGFSTPGPEQERALGNLARAMLAPWWDPRGRDNAPTTDLAWKGRPPSLVFLDRSGSMAASDPDGRWRAAAVEAATREPASTPPGAEETPRHRVAGFARGLRLPPPCGYTLFGTENRHPIEDLAPCLAWANNAPRHASTRLYRSLASAEERGWLDGSVLWIVTDGMDEPTRRLCQQEQEDAHPDPTPEDWLNAQADLGGPRPRDAAWAVSGPAEARLDSLLRKARAEAIHDESVAARKTARSLQRARYRARYVTPCDLARRGSFAPQVRERLLVGAERRAAVARLRPAPGALSTLRGALQEARSDARVAQRALSRAERTERRARRGDRREEEVLKREEAASSRALRRKIGRRWIDGGQRGDVPLAARETPERAAIKDALQRAIAEREATQASRGAVLDTARAAARDAGTRRRAALAAWMVARDWRPPTRAEVWLDVLAEAEAARTACVEREVAPKSAAHDAARKVLNDAEAAFRAKHPSSVTEDVTLFWPRLRAKRTAWEAERQSFKDELDAWQGRRAAAALTPEYAERVLEERRYQEQRPFAECALRERRQATGDLLKDAERVILVAAPPRGQCGREGDRAEHIRRGDGGVVDAPDLRVVDLCGPTPGEQLTAESAMLSRHRVLPLGGRWTHEVLERVHGKVGLHWRYTGTVRSTPDPTQLVFQFERLELDAQSATVKLTGVRSSPQGEQTVVGAELGQCDAEDGASAVVSTRATRGACDFSFTLHCGAAAEGTLTVLLERNAAGLPACTPTAWNMELSVTARAP